MFAGHVHRSGPRWAKLRQRESDMEKLIKPRNHITLPEKAILYAPKKAILYAPILYAPYFEGSTPPLYGKAYATSNELRGITN